LLSSKESIADRLLLNGGTGWTAGTPAAAHKYPVFLVSGNPYNATTMADDVLILIPARMASTRLPGKPLADIAGMPMIVQVLRRAEAARLGPVVVACDDETIATAVEKAGVNVQGDLPTLAPADLAAALSPLSDPAVDIATLCAEIKRPEERTNPNVVKVVGAAIAPRRLRALYFTRATAPSGDGPLYHHIGLYAYRRAALEQFVKLPPSPLEQRERLEQLRALEAGMRVDVTIVDTVPLGVDTPEDLEIARTMLR
jgi:3-deoxy-manno-octulosonate cytidylyltransferase (CMP-KDO synthetase)